MRLFVNVYSYGNIAHLNKKWADSGASADRVCCVEVEVSEEVLGPNVPVDSLGCAAGPLSRLTAVELLAKYPITQSLAEATQAYAPLLDFSHELPMPGTSAHVPLCSEQAMADVVTVGDLNSNARGTGARKSSGKPDWSQIPWWVVSSIFHAWNNHKIIERVEGTLRVIELMAAWQRGQDDALDHAAALLLEVIHAPAGRKLNGLRLDADGQWFPVRALESTVRVLEFGTKKYVKGNWAKGMPWSVCFTCTMSHLSKAFQGEENDEESGLPHTAHAMCNMLFLLGYRDLYPEGDDRLPEFRPGGVKAAS